MDISIVIVNYNSWKVLDSCIESILNLKTSLNVETIVVDNQSPTDLLLQYQEKYPSIKWVRNSGNNGFANGCNLGAKHARGSFLFFLNPDTRMQPSVLEHFISIYDKENIGILSCLQTSNNGTFHKYNLLFPSPLRIFGLLRSFERKAYRKRFISIFAETPLRSFPEWVSGSAVFISRVHFDSISGWNEDYWMYYEDVDLCKKARLQNLKCVVTKEVSIFHLHGGASRINPKTKAITKSEVVKSRHVYISNYFSTTSQAWLHPLLLSNILLQTGILALASFPLFFIGKLKVNRYKWTELCHYYRHVYKNKTWLSERSMNLNR